MKRITLGAVTILAISALVVLPLWHTDAEAGISGNGCKAQGVWIGETPYPLPGNPGFKLELMVTHNGTGDNDGTAVMEFINLPAPPGILWSNIARGVWAKSGPNTYKYTYLAFSVDAATYNILGAIRHAGTATLTDCNSFVVAGTMEDLDPETMQPRSCVPESATFKRLLLQEPCQAGQ